MRLSTMFLPTMKEVPADAVVASHRLMLRAGMIRKMAAGIYTYLPLGFRVIQKISQIIREEMNHIGAQEISMPMVQPAELWEESGRLYQYGPELLRFKDRKETLFCLGPTHEEMVTALARDYAKSYRQLPFTLYQIQTKFRDEIRPRFGLMRAREFLMKDAYSFSFDQKNAYEIYEQMSGAYHRIFRRCGLDFRAVDAASGSIGGDKSHEFQVLAASGEDAIASCPQCGYAANVELAQVLAPKKVEQSLRTIPYEEVSTPAQGTIEKVCTFLGTKKEASIKTLVYRVDGQPVMVLLRGDHELNVEKLKRALDAREAQPMEEADVQALVGPIGFLGPILPKTNIQVLADYSVASLHDAVVGANKPDIHFIHIDVKRDIEATYFDLRNAEPGDLCGRCGTEFHFLRGIEVGHIFYLGTKYSQAMQATVLNEKGERCTIEMGCYGIGVGRTAAAAIEQHHDEKGIKWPVSIAPFHVHLMSLGNDAEVLKCAEEVYQTLLKAHVEVLFDDRDERPGVKLNDADLIGCPLRLMVGKRGLQNRELEVLARRDQAAGPFFLKLDSDYANTILAWLKEKDGSFE